MQTGMGWGSCTGVRRAEDRHDSGWPTLTLRRAWQVILMVGCLTRACSKHETVITDDRQIKQVVSFLTL